MTQPTAAPEPTRSLVSDIRHYLFHRPAIPTLVDLETVTVKEDYAQRIIQRLGIDVSQYSVLNIHRIGIDAPVGYVFDELVGWEGDSPCWPNHIATLKVIEKRSASRKVVLFGKSIGGWLDDRSGGRVGTLFEMYERTVRSVPGDSDLDNARYLLWDCSGGYPIGVFSVFVRSGMAARAEVEPTQVFFAVGFNPHGRGALSRIHPVRRAWEAIHDRVTGNVLNRFKRMCEIRFQAVREGMPFEPDPR